MVYHLNSECALGLLERGAWEQSLNVTCTEAAGSSVSYLPLWLQLHNGSVRFHLRLSEMWIFIFFVPSSKCVCWFVGRCTRLGVGVRLC